MTQKKEKTSNGNGKGGPLIISGGGQKPNKKPRQPGITDPEFWESAFPSRPYANNIDDILKIPGIDDMAGVYARANFSSDQQRIAFLRVTRRLRKYGLIQHLEFVREAISSTIGMKALGKTLQLQIGTQLIAPAVLREQLSMKEEENEPVQRGSDYRKKENEYQQGNND